MISHTKVRTRFDFLFYQFHHHLEVSMDECFGSNVAAVVTTSSGNACRTKEGEQMEAREKLTLLNNRLCPKIANWSHQRSLLVTYLVLLITDSSASLKFRSA